MASVIRLDGGVPAMMHDETLLRSALETIAEPVVLWTADGRVAFASRSFLDLFGVSRDEVEGASDQALRTTLARHGTIPLPATTAPAVETAHGKRYERRTRALTGGGKLDVFHDISEDQESARRRDELIGVATHDLRSPLANVRSYAGLLLGGKMASNLDPRVRRSAEVIARNADKALKLLQSYFDSQRAEAGALDVDRAPAPLGDLLNEAVTSRKPISDEKGVTITVTSPPGLPTIPVDRERLVGALGAFLDNAVARSEPQASVEVIAESRADEVWFGFVDRGPALDPDDARRTFDRDAQILRERRLGLGFALSVARAIAAAHGGRAGVESAPGRTLFFMTLRG